MDEQDKEQKKKTLEYAIEIRQFEIGLFWQRSLFFWGLVASAFVAYAELSKDHTDLALIVSCFGFVCSVAWTLVNRGSKYWQEAWEQKVASVEHGVLGTHLFVAREKQLDKGKWLSARKFSLSKLAIALSDFSILVWTVLMVVTMVYICREKAADWFLVSTSVFIIIVSIAFAGAMFIFGKSGTSSGQSTNPSHRTHSP